MFHRLNCIGRDLHKLRSEWGFGLIGGSAHMGGERTYTIEGQMVGTKKLAYMEHNENDFAIHSSS